MRPPALPVQDRPRCCKCGAEVSPADLVFAPPCHHPTCGSMAWHPLCLMQARDHLAALVRHLTGGAP